MDRRNIVLIVLAVALLIAVAGMREWQRRHDTATASRDVGRVKEKLHIPAAEPEARSSPAPAARRTPPATPAATVVATPPPAPSATTATVSADVTTSPTRRVTLAARVIDWKTAQPVRNFAILGSRLVEETGTGEAAEARSLAGVAPQYRADGAGGFEIPGIPAPSLLFLRIAAPGYNRLDTGPIRIPADRDRVEQVIRLAPSGSVYGRVVRAGGGNPVPGVRVQLTGERGEPADRVFAATTGADGRFHIAQVESGRSTLRFDPPPPAAGLVRDVSLSQGENTDLGDIELPAQGAAIRGQVVREPGARPQQGVMVELQLNLADPWSSTTRTGADGRFEFAGLSNGPYFVRAPESGVGQQALLAAGQSREILLRLGDITLRGNVLAGGKPAAAHVYLLQGTTGMSRALETRAAEDGRFELKSILPGKWLARVRGDSGGFLEERITIPDRATVERDFALPAGRLIGRVLDDTGAPVSGAEVSAPYHIEDPYESFTPPRAMEATTQRDGTFAITGLPAGTYALRAGKPGVGFGSHAGVDVPATGDSAPVEIRLAPGDGGTIVSTALSYETGQPVKEAYLALYDPAGRVSRHTTRGEDGVARVAGLAPGNYRVEVSASGYSVDNRSVPVRDGGTKAVTSVLYRAGALRAFVANRAGEFLEGVAMRLEPRDPASIETPREGITGTGGLWLARGLTPGAYTVTASPAGGSPLSREVEIRGREITETLFELP